MKIKNRTADYIESIHRARRVSHIRSMLVASVFFSVVGFFPAALVSCCQFVLACVFVAISPLSLRPRLCRGPVKGIHTSIAWIVANIFQSAWLILISMMWGGHDEITGKKHNHDSSIRTYRALQQQQQQQWLHQTDIFRGFLLDKILCSTSFSPNHRAFEMARSLFSIH